MSPTGSESAGAAPSTAQIEALIRDCAALTEALAKARRVRQMVFFAVVVFVGAACVMFYNLGTRLGGDEYKTDLLKEAQGRLANNSEQYMREVQTLVDRSTPVLTAAFSAQVKKDLPKFLKAVETERDQLAKDLQVEMTQQIEGRYAKVLGGHRAVLEAEFPMVKDPVLYGRMMENLDAAMDRLVKKYYVDEMNGQLTALYDSWDHYPPADLPGPGAPSLEDEFIGVLLELLSHKLTHAEGLANASQ